MDENGYTITPLVFLLLIPVIIFAVAFGDIVNEINQYSTITIGSDVTGGTVSSIYAAIKNGAGDSGRYAAYSASRKVIDNQVFLPDSKDYTKKVVTQQLNAHVIVACSKLSKETGRQIYVNNVLIPTDLTNTTFNNTFTEDDINITQVDPYGKGDPFGFYVVVKGGVPIKVVQEGQVYEGTLPEIRGYSTILGIEDPYIWLESSFRSRDIIYEYPKYEKNYLGNVDYHFADNVSGVEIQYLWYCLNGTDNPQNQSLLPYYFPDQSGLNFFERLHGGQISGENNETRMSTFIIGNPLSDIYRGQTISALDHEYFAGVSGSSITINGTILFNDPAGKPFYLSPAYKTYFSLANNYDT